MITTLNIKQLLERWPQYSELNILELANDGHFGLYFRPGIKRKTHNDAIKLTDDSIKKATASLELPGYKASLLHFEALKDKFLQLVLEKAFLFQSKPGFERLALSIEIELCGICDTGSIGMMLLTTKIPHTEYNNTFGFFKNDDRYICNSYELHRKDVLTNIWPRDYKRYLDIDDLFVFIDQIERFEKEEFISKKNRIGENKRNRELLADGLGTCEAPLIAGTDAVDVSRKLIPDTANDISEYKQNKPKQKRAHALNELIEEVYAASEEKSARAIWDILRKMADNGHETLQEVTLWRSPNASISWLSHRGKEPTKKRRAFENQLSKLKNPRS
jgi:hypothetical protein